MYIYMQPVVDTELTLPEELRNVLPSTTDVYRSWDLVELTQNYFKLLLHHLLECKCHRFIAIKHACDCGCKMFYSLASVQVQVSYSHVNDVLHRLFFAYDVYMSVLGEGGILIHCISGWDRTPLFISIMRLSLWAVSGA